MMTSTFQLIAALLTVAGTLSGWASDMPISTVRDDIQATLVQYGVSQDIDAAEEFWFQEKDTGAHWAMVRYRAQPNGEGQTSQTTATCRRANGLDPWTCAVETTIAAQRDLSTQAPCDQSP